VAWTLESVAKRNMHTLIEMCYFLQDLVVLGTESEAPEGEAPQQSTQSLASGAENGVSSLSGLASDVNAIDGDAHLDNVIEVRCSPVSLEIH